MLHNHLHELFVKFLVDSNDYHQITTLLYEGEFDVHVPYSGILFRGTITHYSTSVTNLYKEGQVGTFSLKVKEVVQVGELER